MSTLLSKKTDYALLILSHLTERSTGGSAREIADRFGLSKGFLANILKELCQKGFLISHRGVKGGYTLARTADQISLAELLESLEDGWKLTTCTGQLDHEEHDCSVHYLCPIRGPLNEIHKAIVGVLRNVSLADVMGQKSATTTFQPVLSILGHREPALATELHEITA
ncbi:MAG TPA: Rrf2 family transcriptional regulator [Gemmataceae bacterium]|jgi:Rrf2 family protein|nr:Rrf2 family transcriptional regulator [Gemmataceae bacterium]